MPKCLSCGTQLPEGTEYCPPRKLREGKRVSDFKGCYSIRIEELRMRKGGRRLAPRYRSDHFLKILAEAGHGRTT